MVQQQLTKVLWGGDAQVRRENQPLRDWAAELRVSYAPLAKSTASFTVLATVGILFWHYYPGEGKTWLQAVYMSVITLSTVGFGAFNATTEGGKVFGAFWMLFGVATLGALISTFIDTMSAEKQVEARRKVDLGGEFDGIMKTVTSGGNKMDKAQFLKFALMLTKQTDPADFDRIDLRFKQLLNKDDGQMAR